MEVSPHGHRQRLRNRFLQSGFIGFADYEVIELLLTLIIPRRDVKPEAKLLIQKFGSLAAILNAHPSEFQNIPGIGTIAPIIFKIIKETASLYLHDLAIQSTPLNSINKLADFWRSRIGSSPIEIFEVGFLDSSYSILPNGISKLSEGSINHITIYPRQIITQALIKGATGLVLAHNHPNGHIYPSHDDILFTRKMMLCARELNIDIVDHLIISSADFYSFRKSGLLDSTPISH